MKYVRFVKWLAIGLAVLVVIAGAAYLYGRGCHKNTVSSWSGGGASSQGAPSGWTVAPVEETPLVENPLRKSKAGKETEGVAAGGVKIKGTTAQGSEFEVVVGPGGEVYVPPGYDVTVYKKRPSLFALGVDPIVGVGLSAADKFGPGILAGVDVVKIGPARIGAGALVDPLSPVSVAGGAMFGADVYKNVGIRGFAGAGNHGWAFGAAVTLTIR